MTHGSLFSGIGGFEIAAESMGWENVFHCEINPFGQRVLKYHYPNSISYDDITKTDFTVHRGQIDIITGGFPCQPYSQAGKRLGKEDDRHLWPKMLRVIREVQPRWVVGENVFGLINWNDGLVFDEVQADLEAEGYEVQPYVLPAVAVNAPHRRDRVWFVAFKDSNKYGWRSEFWKKESSERKQWDIGSRNNEQLFTDNGEIRTTTNTNSIRCDNGGDNWKERHLSRNEWITEKSQSERNGRERRVGKTCETTPNSNGSRWQKLYTSTKSSGSLNDCGFTMYTNCTGEQGQHVGCTGQGELDRPNSRIEHIGFDNFPTQSPICSRNDGLPTELDGITFPKWRAESIKAYGNAVVPQVVIQIFKAIEQYEQLIVLNTVHNSSLNPI